MKTIGRKEFVDFPELNLQNIEAKIDTGAYGIAMHSHHIETRETKDGEVLHFKLLDPDHPEYEEHLFEVKDFRVKSVKSSAGIAEKRYTFKTFIRVFGKKYKAEVSLTNRKEMKIPVLIGRKFLRKKFVVDVSKKYLSLNQNAKKQS